MDPILENLNRERRKRYRERARRRRRIVLIQRTALAAVVIAIIATTIIVVAKEEKKPINTQAATDSEEVTTEAETTPAAVPTEEPATQAPPKFQEQHSMDWDAEESYLLAKIAMAEELIRELLSDGEEVPSEKIFTRAKELGIGMRTVNAAKKNIPEIKSRRSGNHWCWSMEA